MSWTTPADIKAQVQRRWDRGLLLKARITGETLYPMALRLRRPTSRDLAQSFDAVQDWVRALREGARERRGFGYEIEWVSVNHRVHGMNEVPKSVLIPDEPNALRLIGKTREAERFDAQAAETLARFPLLRPWVERHPLGLIERAELWPEVLAVLDWFEAHPRPGLYLRQVDIPGVDTKFIESHLTLLGSLLDLVLPRAASDEAGTGSAGFEQRYGLLSKPNQVRFRVLDPKLSIRGLSDVSARVDELSDLQMDVEHVFITENLINGLAFPPADRSIVIFGLGYGVEMLAEISWLRDRSVHYWGDLDTHGFRILDRLRTFLPNAQSFLMDRATLEAHRLYWGEEPVGGRFLGELEHLRPEELSVFLDLRDDRLGTRVRLEQERIRFGWVRQAASCIRT